MVNGLTVRKNLSMTILYRSNWREWTTCNKHRYRHKETIWQTLNVLWSNVNQWKAAGVNYSCIWRKSTISVLFPMVRWMNDAIYLMMISSPMKIFVMGLFIGTSFWKWNQHCINEEHEVGLLSNLNTIIPIAKLKCESDQWINWTIHFHCFTCLMKGSMRVF